MAEIAVVVAISAAVAGATAGLQYALTPKPKPVERGRLQGDLQLQDSNYGVPIPEVGGGMAGPTLAGNGVKYAGNIIYASEIRKTETRQKSGGKGGPKRADVIEISYDLDLAIMFGRGRLKLVKLWAGPDLLYDATSEVTGAYTSVGSDATYDPLYLPVQVGPFGLSIPYPRYRTQLTTDSDGYGSVHLAGGAILRFYEGTKTQPVDPLIQADMDARLGAGSTPAYRGRSYLSLEKFDFSKYGYVPNFRAQLINAENQTVISMVKGFALRAGLLESDLQLTPAAGVNVRGYLRPARQAPRADLEQLSRAYNVEYADVGGRFTAFVRGRQAYPDVIDAKYLGFIEGGGGDRQGNDPADILEQKILNVSELPRSLDVKHYDPAREGDVGTQRASRQTVGARRAETLELYCTLTADEGRRVAERELYLAWVEGKPATFTLPYTFSYLHPGRLFQTTVGARTYVLRVVEITGPVPGLLKVAAVPERSYVFDQAATSASGTFAPSTPPLPASSAVTFIDLTLLRDSDDQSGMYVAVGPASADGSWLSAALLRDKGSGYEVLETFTLGAILGRAVTALASADPAVTDYANTVTVDLYTGALESATEDQVLAGANAAVLGNEVIQFQTATPVSGYPRRYVLSGLLRARKGTDWGMTHAVGERFVLLDSAVKFVPLDLLELSKTRSYKAVTAGQAEADAATVNWTYDAGALRPYSPVHAEGARDGSGNLTITWARRTRVGSGVWEETGQEPPVGEESEKYEIDVMDGAAVKRTLSATSPSVTYAAADQVTDFGSPQPSVTVRIYQISALVGRGRVREATL
jgi:hypothetical protein